MRIAAVDLGASNGRVIVADVSPGALTFREVARFPNEPVQVGATLHWDVLSLYRGVLEGLRAAGPLDSVGIDSWAVDYGLLDADGALLGNPVHYRDARTDGVAERFDGYELYAATGIATMPFNTVFQLVAARSSAAFAAARTLLLIPDLLSYWLTGVAGTELTNASTTGLLAAGGKGWSPAMLELAGVDASLLPPLRMPGTPAGTIKAALGVSPDTAVTVVASHDTASAVAGVPGAGNFAYISCGTWSLVGVELPAPVVSRESYAAGFTNEIGVDGTVRYLRNVMGLWLLQECMREWDTPLAALLAGAAQAPAGRSVVDATDPAFLAPGDMPARIAAACRAADQPVPATPVEMTRCILDSLALAYRRAIDDARRLAGVTVDVVHMVGGGALNTLLCQLTADACGLPVLAGPVEAGALGNILVQARALGAVDSDLSDMRELVRTTQPIVRYMPRV
ncbi:rhamnulokinase [Dactylosporangium vinaceum]|uniref:Rhamnulokinase family protein n=1 Tax=Dactylosporangium vinaceum TaxID=53362 RepID=A0ABV5MHA6_9ACTN|nr:rhamnulokinase family protein [Dactylosporangium vinaceum]UAB94857.1 rhamnulokinase [Dactylosporangium vinaceum]